MSASGAARSQRWLTACGGERTIDATGKLVLPGGIDAHCHLDQPRAQGLASGGAVMADDFQLGLAVGGLRRHYHDHSVRGPASRPIAARGGRRLSPARDRQGLSSTTHFTWSSRIRPPPCSARNCPRSSRPAARSLKVYMTYEAMRLSDRQILDVLAVDRKAGALIMVHAENHECLAWLDRTARGAGQDRAEVSTRPRGPMVVEREATHRAIALAEIAETPTPDRARVGARRGRGNPPRRARGVNIRAETCPQYLFLTAHDLDHARLRGREVHVQSAAARQGQARRTCGRACSDGLFDILSSDHAPYRFDESGKKLHGPKAPFRQVANGIPGLETRGPLLFSEGVVAGRIDLERFVALNSTNAARSTASIRARARSRSAPTPTSRSGTPTQGRDHPQRHLHHNVDYTPYEGRQLTGWPVTVLSRGEMICARWRAAGQSGTRPFLECGRPGRCDASRAPKERPWI